MGLAVAIAGIPVVGAALLWWNGRDADFTDRGPGMNGFLKAWLWILGISAALFGAAIGVSRNFDHCPLLAGCSSTSADLAMGLLFLGSAGLFAVGTVVIGTIALLRSIDRQTFRGHAPARRGRR